MDDEVVKKEKGYRSVGEESEDDLLFFIFVIMK